MDIREMNTSKGGAEVEQLAQRFGIQYVPTFVFVNADGSVSNTLVGETAEATMRSELDKLR